MMLLPFRAGGANAKIRQQEEDVSAKLGEANLYWANDKPEVRNEILLNE